MGETVYNQIGIGEMVYFPIPFEVFMQTPRTLKFCILKQNPKTKIQALLQWNDFDKEIK